MNGSKQTMKTSKHVIAIQQHRMANILKRIVAGMQGIGQAAAPHVPKPDAGFAQRIQFFKQPIGLP